MRSEACALDVENLSVTYGSGTGGVKAVDGVSLKVPKGEIVALVGESGSGKTSLALGALGLLPGGCARTSGSARFEGEDLLRLGRGRLRRILGRRIGIVFQDAGQSLDPLFSCGYQIAESIRAHFAVSRTELDHMVRELLETMEVTPPDVRRRQLPDELSGGLKQRVCIAIALSCEPSLIIADEPTSSVDSVTASRIVALLGVLNREKSLTVVVITHDLGLAERIAHRIVVMYCGRIVEAAPAKALLEAPLHPYTKALMECRLPLTERLRRIPVVKGSLPKGDSLPGGCHFHPRCDVRDAQCSEAAPPILELPGERLVRCWKAGAANHVRSEG
ncbi:MAG: ABC transporter ATP-binding protein [Candidatus Eisenbacteria bacterium]